MRSDWEKEPEADFRILEVYTVPHQPGRPYTRATRKAARDYDAYQAERGLYRHYVTLENGQRGYIYRPKL